jgi:hypothetical protein
MPAAAPGQEDGFASSHYRAKSGHTRGMAAMKRDLLEMNWTKNRVRDNTKSV